MEDMQQKIEEVKQLLEESNVEIRVIIAPPRTGSTMVEASLTMSEDVTGNSNEPFKLADSDPETAIENLKKDILAAKREGSRGVLILKDMSGWTKNITPFIHQLTDYPILFLIRNPHLSMESRAFRYMQKMPTSGRIPTREWIADVSNMSFDEVTQELQPSLFEKFAQENGHESWEQMLQHMKREGNYSLVNGLMESAFPVNLSGFEEIQSQIMQTNESGNPYIVVDSSEFRLHPIELQKEISQQWDIEFSEKMTEWGNEGEKFQLGDRTKNTEVWFGTIKSSTGVLPPREIPLPSSSFSKSVKKQIESDMAIYRELIKDPNRVSANIDNDVLIEVNKELALNRGIISEDIFNNTESETVSIPFRLIDPETHSLLNQERKTNIEGQSSKSRETL